MSAPLIMWSITQIAQRDGVSKQAVSKAVKRLVENGDLPVERNAAGHIVSVSVAHYDHARERFSDPARLARSPERVQTDGIEEPEPTTRPGPTRPSDSFDEARRQEMWLRVSRERLRRQETAKQLVRADMMVEAVAIAGRSIAAIVSRLPNRADDLALCLSQEGVHGVRTKLREVSFDLLSQIADALEGVGVEAPVEDPGIVEQESEVG